MSTDLTASCDGTTNHHVNLESRHIALRVEPYSDAPDANPSTTHKVRLLGVDASVDHMSETQVRGWKRKADEVSQLYHESPFAERTQTSLSPDDLVLKLCGMNGDHAEDQKKTFRLMREWKDKATYCKLGQEAMVSLLHNEWDCLHPVIEVAMQKKIEQAGGLEAWEALPLMEKTARDVAAMRDLSIHLGKEVFSQLPESVRRSLMFLIWAGCCMHKELNSIKGGDYAMQAAWALLGLEPPMLLANKDNAAVLELGNVSNPANAMTAAEEHVIETSNRGGVKATSLAGVLFNHKD